MKVNKPYNYIGDPKLRGKAEELAKQVYKEGIVNTDYGTLFDQVETEDINLAKLQDLDDITVGDKEGFVVDNDVDSQEISIEFNDGEIETYSYTELNKLINKGSRQSANPEAFIDYAPMGTYTPMGSSSSKGEYLMVTKKGDKYEGKIGRDISAATYSSPSSVRYVILDFGNEKKTYKKSDVTDKGFDAYGLPNPPDDAIVSDVYDDEFFKWGNAKITEDWERSPLEFDDKGEIIFKPNTSEAEKKRIKAEFEKDLKDMGKMRYDNGGALDKEFKFDKNFVIYVPSTTNVGSKINQTEMDVRVNSVGEFVADKFGGFTKTETDGGYKATDGDIIEEDIVKVSVFAKDFDWDKHEQEVVEQVKEWAKKWGQEAIGFEYEGQLYYIDDEGKFMDGGEIEESLPYTATFKEGGEIYKVKGFRNSKREDELDWSEDEIITLAVVGKREKGENESDIKSFTDAKKYLISEGYSIEKGGSTYAEGGEVKFDHDHYGYSARVPYKGSSYLVEMGRDWNAPFKDVVVSDGMTVVFGGTAEAIYMKMLKEKPSSPPKYALGGKLDEMHHKYKYLTNKEVEMFNEMGHTDLRKFNSERKFSEKQKIKEKELSREDRIERLGKLYSFYENYSTPSEEKQFRILEKKSNELLEKNNSTFFDDLSDSDISELEKLTDKLAYQSWGVEDYAEGGYVYGQKFEDKHGMLILQDRDKYDKDIWTARRYSGESKRNVGIVEVSESELSKMKRIYAEGGNIGKYDPIKNRPVTYVLKNAEGKEVFKTKSGNKASDERASRYFKGEETSITSIDSKGNTRELFELQSEEKKYAEGGKIEMIEIAEDGSNVPPKLMEVFSEFNEDEDPYKEMEKLRAKANEIGYDFSYGLDGTPTEFCEIPKKSWGGGIAIGTAVGGYVGYKIGRARTQKKGFETEKKIGRGIKKTFSKKK